MSTPAPAAPSTPQKPPRPPLAPSVSRVRQLTYARPEMRRGKLPPPRNAAAALADAHAAAAAHAVYVLPE